jgi:hypothetical protein
VIKLTAPGFCEACGARMSLLIRSSTRWQTSFADLRKVRYKRIAADVACSHCHIAAGGIHHADCPLEACPRCLQTGANYQCVKTRTYYQRLRSRSAGLALLSVAALLNTTVCGPTRGSLDRQLAAAQVAAERATADAALAAERARVQAIHGGVR